MPYSLAAMVRKAGVRRRNIKFRPLKARPGQVVELRAIYALIMEAWDRHVDAIAEAYRVGFIGDAPADVNRVIDIVMVETNRALVTIRGRVRNWTNKVERQHREQWRAGILTASGIDVGTMLHEGSTSMTVAASVERNVGLIRSINEDTRAKIADLVFRSVKERKPGREVAAAIRAQTDFSRKRAENVAADQTTKLYAALDETRQREAGLAQFIWRHSGKVHARPEHLERDGTLFNWEAGEGPGEDPPDEDDMPGVPPFCGCTAQAALVDEEGNVM